MPMRELFYYFAKLCFFQQCFFDCSHRFFQEIFAAKMFGSGEPQNIVQLMLISIFAAIFIVTLGDDSCFNFSKNRWSVKWLLLDHEHKNTKHSQYFGGAIQRRFFVFLLFYRRCIFSFFIQSVLWYEQFFPWPNTFITGWNRIRLTSANELDFYAASDLA